MTARCVLVTGGSGLVGQGIQQALRENDGAAPDGKETKWVFLSSKDCDLTDAKATLKMMQEYKPTQVIHLAAQVGGLFKNMRMKADMMMDNMTMNVNVLQSAHAVGCNRVVSVTSTCVFPDKTSYPIYEDSMHDGPPHTSNEGYAYAKRMLDVMSRCYNEQHGTKFTTVIPTNVFGPHDNYNLQDSHVLPGLMHKALICKRDGKDFIVWGSGKPLRQFVYSVDLGRFLIWRALQDESVEAVCCSPDESDEVSIETVARSVAKLAGVEDRLQFDTSKADGQFKKTASNARLRSLCPNFKFTDFETALENSWKWFEENYDSCRK